MIDSEAFEELLGDFLLEAEEQIGRVEEVMLGLAAGGLDDEAGALDDVRRQLHTLKGNSGMMGLTDLRRTAHELEDRVAALDRKAPEVEGVLAGLDRCRAFLDRLRASGSAQGTPPETAPRPPAAAGESSVRVPLARLDRLTRLMTEQLMAGHRLAEAMAAAREGAGGRRAAWRRLEEDLRSQERILDSVRHEVLALRMVPLRPIFGRLRRLAHDEAGERGRSIRFQSRGEDTPLDRSLVEVAGGALGHLVRNAVVHGIESPSARRRSGKPEAGTVLVRASVAADTVLIEVIDDGAGIDRERVRRAAHQAGLAPEDDNELDALVFLPGLSTHGKAELGAGRGVGLAAVREGVRHLGGDVEVTSLPGVGTRFGLKLPVSVSTTEVLLVEADGRTYALPVAAVVETASTSSLAGDRSEWRGRRVDPVDLGSFFGTAASAARLREFVAVLESEGRLRAIAVDRLGELKEVVVQELDPMAARPGLTGSTVLADGRVVLVLDPHALTGDAPERAEAS